MAKNNVYIAGLAALLLISAGCAANEQEAAADRTPYAGYEEREIAALSLEKTGDLLGGKGAGYALAAEVNGYPGPRHALDMEKELELTAEQKEGTERLFAGMKQEAVELGEKIVDLERELDHAFKSGEATDEQLQRLTDEIAKTEGRLRYTHLTTHLEMKKLLTAEQVERYNELRGYTGEHGASGGGHDQKHGGY
ncbi:Spy/CpxP family protein refolding chaperone [Paenibacillus alkalitolerans]|uniref:Spy/CpxP family protein refolding chaperone n=1 Tax=Paenibacillus alkalitolerans TaxID=2799335 RepID=UPI0018F512DE|nr:Spy/CpxP family protein refolding chaperone [Paenibacillus alkalitolerans]